jgi:hypothetical protein
MTPDDRRGDAESGRPARSAAPGDRPVDPRLDDLVDEEPSESSAERRSGREAAG